MCSALPLLPGEEGGASAPPAPAAAMADSSAASGSLIAQFETAEGEKTGPQLDVPVTVVMPTVAPMTKVQNCRAFGANVIIHGAHNGEANTSLSSHPRPTSS